MVSVSCASGVQWMEDDRIVFRPILVQVTCKKKASSGIESEEAAKSKN